MKIVASIQARLGSTRLPKKVLKEINGKPMLLRQVERLRSSRLVDEVIVATTVNPNDDEIVVFCKDYGIKYFRGSEDDVLNRISSLILENEVDIHVECFGDSPFTDPHIVDEVVGYYLKYQDKYDFVSNSLSTTYPPGLEVLVYSGKSLIKADSLVEKNDPLREHVSIHITQKPEVFRIKNLEAPEYYSFPEVYLEVDTPEDFEVVSTIFKYFDEQGNSHFSLAQILDFLKENQELVSINSEVERRWKQFRKDDNV
jgi:spore coat polysaccharide biosynthesis protein SpsF